METSQFEAVKVGMKQDNSGYILTLRIHPDEVPDEIMRDFVGARYMTVMVRVNADERPMNREEELGRDMVRVCGILCRDKEFWDFLHSARKIDEATEAATIIWIKEYLEIKSRADIPKSQKAIEKMLGLKQEFNSWKQNV